MKTIITPSSIKNTALAIVTMALCLTSQPATANDSPHKPAASVPAELALAVAVPAHPGFVKSPYALNAAIIDVTGLQAGSEVKCPHTGKLFRVPPTATAIAQAKAPSDALIFGNPSSWLSKDALLA